MDSFLVESVTMRGWVRRDRLSVCAGYWGDTTETTLTLECTQALLWGGHAVGQNEGVRSGFIWKFFETHLLYSVSPGLCKGEYYTRQPLGGSIPNPATALRVSFLYKPMGGTWIQLSRADLELGGIRRLRTLPPVAHNFHWLKKIPSSKSHHDQSSHIFSQSLHTLSFDNIPIYIIPYRGWFMPL